MMKIRKSNLDPIEEYLEKISALDLRKEDENEASPIFDILFGFLFHIFFVLIFLIFLFQNENISNECKSFHSKYWTKILIFYHSIGAFCNLIVIPIAFVLKRIFFKLNSLINNLILITRTILTAGSFFVFYLVWKEYDWGNECQSLNDLLYIYVILCVAAYGILIFLGICLVIASSCANEELFYKNIKNSNISV